jgi:hypothetical protein
MRIMSKKLQQVVDQFLLRKALWKISNYGEREEYIQENICAITERKRDGEIHKYFGEWRHRYAVKQMGKVVKVQS